MKILAVDTASRSCSVAILNEKKIFAEISNTTGETHSKHLIGMIESAIRLSGLTKKDLDAYSVSIGPGSFTGLRIGISTIKGLSEASGKPAAGVSSLDALAFGFSDSNLLVCSMLDARRGEVYFSCMRFREGVMVRVVEEGVMDPGSVASAIHEPCLFVGDGSVEYRKVISEKASEKFFFVQPEERNAIRAASVGYLGMKKIKNGEASGTSLIPRYIRKCDAEINKPVC
jgi:tRNA threonylcarbamoyladenosine biosynthesis protein TsaB